MRLLILTPQLPYPPQQGTSLRNFYILRGLADSHRITLLSYVEDGDAVEIPPQLDALCSSVVTVTAPTRSGSERLRQLLSSSKPDMAQRLFSPAYSSALQTLLQEGTYDVVQVEGIEMAWTIPLVREYAPETAVVYDAHNAETLLQTRAGTAELGNVRRWPAVAYSWIQRRRLAEYERWVLGEVDGVTAVSDKDRQALQQLTPERAGQIEVIPNSLDIDQYAQDAGENGQAGGEAGAIDVLFSGKMDYRPNVDAVLWFAKEVWPLIRESRPDSTWVIAGQKPHARLELLKTEPGITVTGWVAEMSPYLAASRTVILPFRIGSGTRLKLIEALAAAKGVVSTTVGVEGFPVENGKEVLIGDSAAEFASLVLRLLENPGERRELGRQGQTFVQRYDWRNVVPKFDLVYERILGPGDGG